jgi:hypothetical protein
LNAIEEIICKILKRIEKNWKIIKKYANHKIKNMQTINRFNFNYNDIWKSCVAKTKIYMSKY